MKAGLLKQCVCCEFKEGCLQREGRSTLIFFYKQLVYKQLVLRQQIAKQLSGLSPFSLSNNKNCRLNKSGVFPL